MTRNPRTVFCFGVGAVLGSSSIVLGPSFFAPSTASVREPVHRHADYVGPWTRTDHGPRTDQEPRKAQVSDPGLGGYADLKRRRVPAASAEAA